MERFIVLRTLIRMAPAQPATDTAVQLAGYLSQPHRCCFGRSRLVGIDLDLSTLEHSATALISLLI